MFEGCCLHLNFLLLDMFCLQTIRVGERNSSGDGVKKKNPKYM